METKLSRRERQILDILYRKSRASAQDVMEALDDSPGYSAVRTLLRILEEKGHIRHEEEGAKYVYSPVVSRSRARKQALAHMVETFFEGSPEQVVATLIDSNSAKMSAKDLDRLADMIEQARKRRPS